MQAHLSLQGARVIVAKWAAQRVIVKEELATGGPRRSAGNAIIFAVTIPVKNQSRMINLKRKMCLILKHRHKNTYMYICANILASTNIYKELTELAFLFFLLWSRKTLEVQFGRTAAMLPCHLKPELIPTNAQTAHLSPSGRHLLRPAATGSGKTYIANLNISVLKQKMLGTLYSLFNLTKTSFYNSLS